MSSATLLPEPDNPLTTIRRIVLEVPAGTKGRPDPGHEGPAFRRSPQATIVDAVMIDSGALRALALARAWWSRTLPLWRLICSSSLSASASMAAYMSSSIASAWIAGAARRTGRLRLVTQFLDGQDALHVDQLVAMPHDAREFLLYVTAQGRCDFDVVSAEVHLHVLSSGTCVAPSSSGALCIAVSSCFRSVVDRSDRLHGTQFPAARVLGCACTAPDAARWMRPAPALRDTSPRCAAPP